MKKYLNKSIALLLIAALLIGVICLIFSRTNFTSAYADSEYLQDYTELTDEQLDALSVRSTESDEAPQITVFTHGLGGKAGHWSNHIGEGGTGDFAYESDSMIEQLRQSIEAKEKAATMFAVRIGVGNVNYAKTTVEESQSEILNTELTHDVGSEQLRCMYNGSVYITHKQVLLYNNDSNDYCITGENNLKTHITSDDVSKHIILVFNAEESNRSNDYVYAQFEYILDVISYQYRQLTGTLPKYNLIGHSRGGITNMQYALAHPYNVASLYSMGTPYNSTAFGSAGDLFLSIGGTEKTDRYYKDGVVDYPPGTLDILNYDLNESYKSFWNTYYDQWYSHIKFRPIGSYVTGGFILQSLADILEDNSVAENIVRGVVGAIEIAAQATEYLFVAKHLVTTIIVTAIDKITNLIVDAFPNAPAWIKILKNISIGNVQYEHLGVSLHGLLVLEDDLYVDLNSQVAYGYKGTEVKVRLMDSADQINSKKSVNDVGIGHNIETHQKDIVNYVVRSVLEDIDLTTNDIFSVRYQGENFEECVITRAKTDGAVILNVPDRINGKTVVGIESLSESVMIGQDSVCSENTSLQTVIIPDTVKYLGKGAFSGMKNLKEIQFGSNSQLEKINDYAFMSSGLTGTITLPKTVNFVGGFAFAYCTGITGFIANGSNIYDLNGVLYSSNNGNVELTQYPTGKADKSFTIPSEVGIIGKGAFVGNENIVSIDLGNSLHRIGLGAFGNCTNLSKLQNGNNIGFVEATAFDGTKWLTGDVKELSIGSVLVKYNGNDRNYVLPYKYTAIYSMAFDGSNVQNLIITNINEIVSVCDMAIDKIINVEVPYKMLPEYQANTHWNHLQVSITSIQSVVEFDSNGGTAVELEVVYYGDYLDFEVPTRSGYQFIGWSYNGDLLTNENGNTFDIWKNYDDVILVAEWRPESYIIKLTLENEDELWLEAENGKINLSNILKKVQYGEEIGYSFSQRLLDILKNNIIYNVPGKTITGFMINGEIIDWDNSNILPDLGDEIELEIELIYEDEIYNITFETNSSTGTYTKQFTYNQIIEYPDLKATSEAVFGGWYYDFQFSDPFTYERMPDLTPDDEGTANITIYAKWIALYKITFDSNGGTTCESITAARGEIITLPTPTRTGYDGTWGDYNFGDSFTVTGPMTLIAEWTGKYYTITFDFNGGYGGTTSSKVQYNGSMPNITFPKREGHKLDYFYDSNDIQYYVNATYDSKAYTFTNNITLTAQWSEAFLIIENIGNDGGWKIRVTNTSSTTITVDYNTLMCLFGDAQKWTGLSDVESFDLEPGASAEKTVKGNWFATSVTFSYVAGNYRYITYADGLHDDRSINVRNNRVLA